MGGNFRLVFLRQMSIGVHVHVGENIHGSDRTINVHSAPLGVSLYCYLKPLRGGGRAG